MNQLLLSIIFEGSQMLLLNKVEEKEQQITNGNNG